MITSKDAEVQLSKPVFGKWPYFSEEEISAATQCLATGKVNYWTGQEGRQFEREFAAWSGTNRAIAVGNGTLALELAIKGLKLVSGDEVVTTPRTFVATATSCIVHGIRPVFADVDRDSGAITVETIERAITPKTRAILVVHLGGWPADMPAIMEFAKSNGLKVIEDCAQANGAKINGRSVGSFGQVNAWSFCQDKIISTGGEGGMVTTDDESIWDWMWSFKDHGKTWEAVYEREHPIGFRWLHERFGTNWRLTEIQSAIGRIQLRKLADWQAIRTRNALILNSRLGDHPMLKVPKLPGHLTHAWYRWYGHLNLETLKSGVSREMLMQQINELGVPITVGSCSEIYLERSFARCHMAPAERLPVAQELGATSLALLTHPTLSEEAMHYTADVLEKVLDENKR